MLLPWKENCLCLILFMTLWVVSIANNVHQSSYKPYTSQAGLHLHNMKFENSGSTQQGIIFRTKNNILLYCLIIIFSTRMNKISIASFMLECQYWSPLWSIKLVVNKVIITCVITTLIQNKIKTLLSPTDKVSHGKSPRFVFN